MSQFHPQTFQIKFQNNVETQLQLLNDPLEQAIVTQDDASAEKIKIKDLVGNNAPQEADERHGATKWSNRGRDGVWLAKPNELYDTELVDDADQLATSIGLMGSATQSAIGTIQRARVRRYLEGFYGPIISGKDGTISTPFPAGQIVPVTEGGAAGAQRFNVAKILAADQILTEGFADTSKGKYMALTAKQNRDLLLEIPATSSDFKGSYKGEVDDEGRVTRLLGWRFIPLELANPLLGTIPALSVDGSGYRKTPFWVKGGLVANFWKRLRTKTGELPERLFSMGALWGTTVAATRTQPGLSGIILNSEA
jgi:hypothetical protein